MLFWLIVACGLWLIFGSFGSVILSRRGDATTRKQASSILWGRSECPTCKHRLYPYDLIPLLSFLFQWGKCRYCHRKISWLYPILELGSAMIFGLLYWYLWSQGLWVMMFWIVNAWILWLLLVYDVLWYEVHIPLVLVGMGSFWVGLLARFFPMKILWWGLVFLLFFLLLYGAARRVVKVKYWVKEEGLGFWDVIISPYLGGLLYAGLNHQLSTLDQVLAFLFFLTLSWGIWLVWYFIQTKLYQKKATFLSQKMADQAVPFLPAMILWVAVILIFQEKFFSLFWF